MHNYQSLKTIIVDHYYFSLILGFCPLKKQRIFDVNQKVYLRSLLCLTDQFSELKDKYATLIYIRDIYQ